ncbi:MAG: hypothetical protein HOV87_35415 [Catenulispora sp.]|nr:hypothetical protein [Catenulispora sp.]
MIIAACSATRGQELRVTLLNGVKLRLLARLRGVARRTPATSFIRALIDAARDATNVDEVRAMMAEAIQRRFCTPGQILDEVRDGPVRHSQLARKVALEIADGIRSPAEGWLREAFIRFRVPPPRWNTVLRDAATGQIIAIPDALWANRCVIAEVDSRDCRLSPEDWNRTQERHTMLTALGFAVLHFALSRVKADPEAVCAEVMAALTASASRRWPRAVTMARTDDTTSRPCVA